MLSIDDERCTQSLVDICWKQSLGDPFFLIEFLTMLEEENFLEELKQEEQSTFQRMVWQMILNLTGQSNETICLKAICLIVKKMRERRDILCTILFYILYSWNWQYSLVIISVLPPWQFNYQANLRRARQLTS